MAPRLLVKIRDYKVSYGRLPRRFFEKNLARTSSTSFSQLLMSDSPETSLAEPVPESKSLYSLRHAPGLTTFTRVVILTAFYFIGGLLGKQASFLSSSITLVWPPAGIALAGILLFGYRFWPGVAVGAILFSLIDGVPLGFFTLGTAIGNTVGAVVCAFLLKSVMRFGNAMERTRDVIGYVSLACFLGTSVNAIFNVVGLIYTGTIPWEGLFTAVLQWWVPNALGVLVAAPFIITWATPTGISWNARLFVEALVCAIGLVAGTLISFNSWFVYGIQNYPLAYLPFPFLVWGSLRFGQRGATTGTLLVCGLAIHSLVRGRGPFVSADEVESLMLVGSYIGVVSITNMLLAAAASERRTAERAVSESEKRFRAIVEDQTDLICRFGHDGVLTFVNGAYCRFHRKSREELLGTSFFDNLHHPDADVLLASFSALSEDQPVICFDHRSRGPQGNILWQQHTIRRLFSERGDAIEYQAVLQDITLRKQSEQAVRASEKKYRSLVGNIPDAAWTATAGLELVYISDNVEKILGCCPEELVGGGGRAWLDRIHPNDRARVEEAYQRLFTHGEPFETEYRMRRKNGEWTWVCNRAPASRFADGVPCADGLLSDISQRKHTERALQAAKESAESANRAKSQFLANLSHELRTPLNAIIGFSEMLAEQTFGELNERQLKYSRNIFNSGRHLLQLINDILDLSKVEAGRLELTPHLFDVPAALQSAMGISKALAHKKRIALHLEVSPEVQTIFADEGKFKQILYNLLSNAIKFTPEAGIVTLTAHCETLSNQVEQIEVLNVIVADTGIGIHPHDQERIFNEFVQIDSTYSRQQQGTGLGLTLTKKLVEIHGGRIWVESEGIEGKGSRFIFRLPLRNPVSPGLGNQPDQGEVSQEAIV